MEPKDRGQRILTYIAVKIFSTLFSLYGGCNTRDRGRCMVDTGRDLSKEGRDEVSDENEYIEYCIEEAIAKGYTICIENLHIIIDDAGKRVILKPKVKE